MIKSLTEWVLRTACQQLSRFGKLKDSTDYVWLLTFPSLFLETESICLVGANFRPGDWNQTKPIEIRSY